jgi:hypothetical protein
MRLPRFGDDWRKRWMQLRDNGTLHRVAAITWADSDEIGGHGTTACGRFAELHMPGVISRMAATRCRLCCLVAKVPPGEGAPFNQGIDA